MTKWRESINEYKNDVIGNGLYDVIKFLIGLIVTNIMGTGIAYNLVNMSLGNMFITIIASFIVVVLCTILFVLVYKKTRKYKYHINRTEVNFEYSLDKIVVISQIEVKALRNGLDRIYNRTTWFPDEKTQISCLDKEFSIEQLPPKDTSNEYNVIFNKTLKKGEVITYTIKVVNENKKRHFQDFYSREIITPTDKLSMTIVIPSKYGYKYMTKQVIKGSAYNDFAEKEKQEFLNTYTWEIEKPKLGYEYKLLWEKQ